MERDTDVSPFDVIDSARLLRSLRQTEREGERGKERLKVLHAEDLSKLADWWSDYTPCIYRVFESVKDKAARK